MKPIIIIANFAVIAAMLTATNYGYQAATAADWMAATERSIFQFVAICCCAISVVALTAGNLPQDKRHD